MTVSNAPKIEPNAKEINMAKNMVAHKLELGNLVTTFKMNTYEYHYVCFFVKRFKKESRLTSGYTRNAKPGPSLTTVMTDLPESCAM